MRQLRINRCLLRLFLFFLTVSFVPSSTASPLPSHDVQLWSNFTSIGPLTTNTRYWLEGQTRIGDDISSLSQLLIRPGIGYVVNKNSTIWLGYAFINSQSPFAKQSVDENRLWQQFLWVRKYPWGKLFSRTRLEQRFIDGISTTGWRFRQFARVQHYLNKNRKTFISASEEVFIHLNNTLNKGSNRGFDQNRAFIGIGYLPNPNVLIEIGYQNQYIKRANTQNYVGNCIATNFIFNF